MRGYYTTDKGKTREINQDYIYCSNEQVGILPNLYIVADGMGGYNAGDFASRCCVESFVECVQKKEQVTVISTMTEALNHANRTVLQHARENEEFSGMGTTFVAATVFPDRAYVMNVGDSRLYLVGDEIKQITVDHSYVEEMVRMGNLDRVSARNHPDKNIITRAVGAMDTVNVDFFEVELQKGDIVLMCSDGLTNMIEDEEILEILKREKGLEHKAEELIKTANQNGGKDNIAVVLMEQI